MADHGCSLPPAVNKTEKYPASHRVHYESSATARVLGNADADDAAGGKHNMMVMPANNLSGVCHFLSGRFPGRIGMLNTPHSWKNPPAYMPWALDNGCYTEFNEAKFMHSLFRSRLVHKPIFVAVPDVVCDPEGTNRLWHDWSKKVDFAKAFVCQDGHEPQDVPKNAFCSFVGGSTDWKLKNAHKFKGVCEWLHIGRVTTLARIRFAEEIGADSVDGTGFFRGKGKQYADFVEYFMGKKQISIF